MDMLHQLPGALYRLRSARLPFPQQIGPFRARSVSSSPRKLVVSRFDPTESLKSDIFANWSGFRVYPSNPELVHRILGQSIRGSSCFLRAQGRQLVVVASSRSSKAQDEVDVSVRVSGEGEFAKGSSHRANPKRQVRPQVDSGGSSSGGKGENGVGDPSRWKFKPKGKQQVAGQEGLTRAGSSKNSGVRQPSGKVVSVSGSSPKRGNPRPRKVTDVWSSSYSPKAAYSTVNALKEAEDSSVVGEVGSLKGSRVSSSKVSSGAAMSTQQRTVANKKQEGGDRKPRNERKKEKHFPAEAVLRRDLNMCSKDGDVLKALELYDQSVADGIVKWNQYNFNILLYLCSSASLGTLSARKSGSDRAESERSRFAAAEQSRNANVPEFADAAPKEQNSNGETAMEEEGAAPASPTIVLSPEIMATVAERGFEIYEHMKRLKVPPNEATLTAVARLAVAKGDGDLAFQMVKEMAALNLAPKLRSYSPALFTYCKNMAVKEAFEVDAHMVGVGVHPEEPELAALLQLCVDTGLDEEVYKLLHRLRARVRALSPITVAAIEQWFSQDAATAAGNDKEKPDSSTVRGAVVAGGGGWHGLGWLGEGKWKKEWSRVDDDGVCLSCKEKLATIDLDPKETEIFAHSLAELACTREAKPNDFRKFQEWLEQHGPFDAVVDGANIGLYNQNFAQGGFNFHQLNAVVTALQDQGLAKRPPLIFLHHARTKFGAANSPQAQQLLNKWRSTNSLYTTPNGSNDDWYWMYAAVTNKCLLVTNDEMRDHLFQLLGTDFFPKWKERHQARFTCTNRGPQFHLPPPYSIVIQESEKGAWHIPKDGGDDIDAPREWLCVTRPGVSSAPTMPSRGENGQIPVEIEGKISSPSEKYKLESDGEHKSADDLKSSLLNPRSPESGTEESGVRTKRVRLHPPSATLVKIRAAEKRAENGPIAFEI